MSNTNFDELLNAGCHFGHLTRKWNPKMAPYIFMERNDIHIIDLNKTAIMLDKASAALKQIAKSRTAEGGFSLSASGLPSHGSCGFYNFPVC